MSKYMQQASRLYSGFVGVEHVEALVRFLGVLARSMPHCPETYTALCDSS
eukprot:SAG11_NODE_24764_length_368_cov_0.966543_2_plen_49_part_01